MMTLIYNLQTLAAVAALVASGTFAGLYSRVDWRGSNTGKNLMAMAACLVVLSSGSVVRRLVHVEAGHIILLVGWTLVAVVMVWRTLQMWDATHPRNAPPHEAASPTPQPEGRQWYSPTPHSIIEPPWKDR